jgi:hypothetical protein
MLNHLQAKYTGVEEAVLTAEAFLRMRAPDCGFSTNRNLRYYPTRTIPKVRPRLIIFFDIDEEHKTANLVSIVECQEEE